ncbi:MAG: pyridoxal phosphate-dependent aminotransferase [Phycisphaeraceae bacterium]|nr:pyridoxal phosphate-dependent aminotransferase [Phycisphaeraceae bacterium]MCW5763072.1 pyridoxal phosphate-dependent aminotransferase [Phycisphaeraceae bacterium]
MTDTLSIARRVATMTPSVTVAITNRAKQMKEDGVDVLAFAAGEPDFDTPAPIKEAAIEALRAGQTKYMPTLGDNATRQAIADKLGKENGIPGLSAKHVAISSGGKHALFVAMHCLVDGSEGGREGGSEVILPVPAWVSYKPIAEMAGAKVVEIETTPESEFKITPEQLREAITPRSKVLILNSPSNPCGTMYSEEELRAIAEVVADASMNVAPGLVVLTDEIYEKIVYGGIAHFSIGSVPSIAERTLTLNGMSKAFAMTGWRVGYAAMPGDFGARFIGAMGTLQGQMTTNITSFVYPAIRRALTDPSVAESVEVMRQAFAKRAALTHERLSAIDGFRCVRPTGAFYAFPDVSEHFGRSSAKGRVIGSALDFAEALLEEARVAVVPGEDFGGCGEACVRLSFACGEEQISRGMDRIAEFVSALR